MDTIIQDIRYAVRQLVRAPGFTIVSALTLAIGIGANTALFSFANGVLGRPLPEIGHPEGLYWLAPADTRGGPPALMMSYPDFLDFRDSTNVFSSAAAIGHANFAVSSNGDPVRLRGSLVSGDYFRTLEARMALGRALTSEDDRSDVVQPAVVISHHLWQERFAGASDVLGKRLLVDGRPLTIVGVTPEKFNGAEHAERQDLYVPLAYAGTVLPGFDNFLKNRGTWWLSGIGRLAPGVSQERASAAMATVATRIARADSVNHQNFTARVIAPRGGLGPNDGNDITPVALLAGTVTLLVLLIACANVSNLLLGRAVVRRREIAVRLSLGAARARIVRQLLTESLLLAMVGSLLGVLMASWANSVLAAMIPAPLDVSMDTRVLGFTILFACLTGIGFGLVPALSATRSDVTTVLKDASAGADKSRARLQRGFVVAQVSLSLVLLVTAGMFLGQLYKSSRVNVRFDATDNVLAASFDAGMQGYDSVRAAALIDQAQARLAALPGVQTVSFTNQVPMGERHIGTDITIHGDRNATNRFGENAGMEVYESTIRPDYFKAIGIPFAYGRDFTHDDRVGSEPVAIVSEDFARNAWPDGSAIGKRISTRGEKGPYMTIVGVAREALTMGLSERRRPIVYVPQMQRPSVTDLTVLVRRSSPAAELGAPLRKILRELDRDLPVYDVQSLAQYRYDRGAESRMGSTLLTIFGSLALILATIGVYAVMAFAVQQRTREIGVRVALGAARTQIIGMFVTEGARLASIGVAIGLALSLAVAKMLSAVFLGLSLSDSFTFMAGAIVLGAAALAASFVPARRAASVNPVVALRAD
jgi:putative ABC transport system permease protein